MGDRGKKEKKQRLGGKRERSGGYQVSRGEIARDIEETLIISLLNFKKPFPPPSK